MTNCKKCELAHSRECSRFEERGMCDCWVNLKGKPAWVHMEGCRYYEQDKPEWEEKFDELSVKEENREFPWAIDFIQKEKDLSEQLGFDKGVNLMEDNAKQARAEVIDEVLGMMSCQRHKIEHGGCRECKVLDDLKNKLNE